MSTPSAATLPGGLELARDVITPEEEEALLAACRKCNLRYYEVDPTNPRSRASFGWVYDIPNDRFTPTTPIPAAFRGICERVAAFAGTTADAIIECLVIRYEPGSLIQPHQDKPVFDKIVGLSMASDADMVFSKPDGEVVTVTLPRRSLFLLSGDARYVYRHGIPHMAETRWSMTFRTLTAEGEALRASFAA